MKKRLIILSIIFILSLIIFSGTPVKGSWYYYNDKANDGTSKIIIDGKPTTTFKMKEEVIDGKKVQVALLNGEVTLDFQYGFIGVGIKIEGEGKEIIKKAKGIKFKVIGDPSSKCNWYRVRVETTNVKDFDVFGKRFKAYPDKVTEYTIMFSQLTQQGWGKQVGFNTKFIDQISFQTEGQPYEKVVLKIWDLEIVE